MVDDMSFSLAPGEHYSAVPRAVEAAWVEHLSGRDLALMMLLKTVPNVDTAKGGLVSNRDLIERYPRALTNKYVGAFIRRAMKLGFIRYLGTEHKRKRLRIVTSESELPALPSVYRAELREPRTNRSRSPFKRDREQIVRGNPETPPLRTNRSRYCEQIVRGTANKSFADQTQDTETPSPRGVSLSLSLAQTRDAAGPPREGPTAPESTTTLRTPSERDEHDPELAELIGGLGVAPGRDDEREHREHRERLRLQLEMVRRGEL
jgi:hypothetical protein